MHGCVSAFHGTAVPASTWTALSELHSSSLWMTWDVSRKSERDTGRAIARSPRDNGPTHAHRECATSSWFRVFPHGTKGPAKYNPWSVVPGVGLSSIELDRCFSLYSCQ